MALKGILDKIEDAPEALREHYQPTDDGKFVLAVSDDHPLRRKAMTLLEEKKAAKAQLEALAARYEGIDPEQVKSLRQQIEEINAGKGETVGKLLAERQRQLQEEFGSKLRTTQKERDELKAQADALRNKYSAKLLAENLRATLEKEKIRLRSEGAFIDLARRASEHFTVDPETGKILPRAADSFEETKSANEWLRDRLRDPYDAHLFEDSSGGGAPGARGGKAPNGKIYMSRAESTRPTEEQRKAIAEDRVIFTD